MAEEMLGKVQKNITQYPSGHSNWAKSHLIYSYPFYEVIIVGNDAERISMQLQKLDLTQYIIAYSEKKSEPPMFAHRFKKEETNIYVCQKGACQLPVQTVDAALKRKDK